MITRKRMPMADGFSLEFTHYSEHDHSNAQFELKIYEIVYNLLNKKASPLQIAEALNVLSEGFHHVHADIQKPPKLPTQKRFKLFNWFRKDNK